MPVDEIREAVEIILGFPSLPEATRAMLLQLLESLKDLESEAGPSEIRKAMDAFWVQKGLGLLDARTTGARATPEDVAAKLMKDARELAARGKPPGGPGFGGRISKPEPMDEEFSRKLQEGIDEAVEKARQPRGGRSW